MRASFFSGTGPCLRKSPGVEFFGQQRVLKAVDRPLQDRADHLGVEILAQLTAAQTVAHKLVPSVGIFRHQEAVNLATQRQVGPVVADQINAVRRPVVADHPFAAPEPVAQHGEKTLLHGLFGRFHVLWKRVDRTLVGFEKQPVFALEMLKYRPFGDAEVGGNIFHPRRTVAVLGKMPDGRVHDAGPFGLRTGTRLGIAPELRRFGQAAGNSVHD